MPESIRKFNGRAAAVSEAGIGPAQADMPTPEDARLAWLSWNDLGNSERLRARFGDDLIWTDHAGWHAWDGRRWNNEDGPRLAQVFAQRTAAQLRVEFEAMKAAAGEDTQKGFLKHVRGSGQSGAIASMLREAAPHLARSLDDLDAHPFLFNVANGTLELGLQPKFRPHARADMLTLISPVAYLDPDEDQPVCPKFDEFFSKIQPDPDMRRFLLQWYGYCMTGDTREQRIMMQHGAGSNGKSTLIHIISHVLGEYAITMPVESLLADDRRGGANASPDLARLPGRRFVATAEPETSARISESRVKSLTGGDVIAARQLNKPFFEFKPVFKPVMSFNPKPRIVGSDDGIWRRVLLVPFEHRVEKTDVGPMLEVLDAEAPGILHRLLAGCVDWFENGLIIPAAVREATLDYRSESDPIGRFLAECVEAAPGHTVAAGRLWDLYCRWCRPQAIEPGTFTKFGRTLGDKRLPKQKIGGFKVYLDLDIKPDAEQEIDEALASVSREKGSSGHESGDS